ncbi:MAG: hypothetical protein ABJC10_12935 [Acidobacteriota bacterium]
MTGAARSLFVFGIYLVALGVLLLFFPNLLLRIFGAPRTNEIWIRVNGMFVIAFSYYYIQAARHGVTAFIRWTVWARAAVIIYLVAFVLLAGAPKPLLLFGVIDLLSATWTFMALQKEATRTATR